MSINPIALPLRLGGAVIGTVRGGVRAAARLTRDTSQAMLALPRIARALEQLVPAGVALRQLNDLRGTIRRLEQLGNFVAEELPEAVYQLEELRAQLSTIDRRLVSLSAEFAALDRAVHTVQAATSQTPASQTPEPGEPSRNGAPATRRPAGTKPTGDKPAKPANDQPAAKPGKQDDGKRNGSKQPAKKKSGKKH